MKSVCILIPVYNNPHTISNVVAAALEQKLPVIVIDDGSDIAVSSLLKPDPMLTVIRHNTNKGKGEALISGFKEAKKEGYDFAASIDGDGQHYPAEIHRLIPLIEANTIVIGNRVFQKDVPGSSKFGRVFSNFWIFMESGVWLHDTQSGFRIYPLNILELHLQQSHYDFEIEVLVKHLWQGGKIAEADIEVYYPPKGERVSHFDKIVDNIRLSRLHAQLVIKNILRILFIPVK